MVAFTLTLVGSVAVMQAQSSQASVESIDALRGQIRNLTEQQSSNAKLGRLWLKLAIRYQNEPDFVVAEDAFGQSLRLLRSDASVDYADALEGMGELYLATGRLSEAESESKRGLEICRGLCDGARLARLHETTASAQLVENRFSDSEAESSEALRMLATQARPDLSEELAEHLTHSYALCYLSRCREALNEIDHAMALVKAGFGDKSLEMAGVWMARGLVEWKAGSPGKGEEGMRSALSIVRGRTDLPQAIWVKSQTEVLRTYAACLKQSHRDPEARLMEVEVARLQHESPATCGECTVSVVALGTVLR